MKVVETKLKGVLVFEPRVHYDERGFLLETWNRERYATAGLNVSFVQDNLSFSRKGVLRGLHFQTHPHAQGKLVSVLEGEIFDVAVDLRTVSPTFGNWFGAHLSSKDRRQIWIPVGFAHGFVVTGDTALVSYKCTDIYSPRHQKSLAWNDPEINIEWPVASPELSERDAAAPRLSDLVLEPMH